MDIRFADPALERLYTDPAYNGGEPPAVVSSYRAKVGIIESAADERDFYAMRSLRYEKLKGKRSHQHSMRLNDQWRLVIALEGDAPERVVAIVSIEA
jgi:proteic killer suppression protein